MKGKFGVGVKPPVHAADDHDAALDDAAAHDDAGWHRDAAG